MKNKFINYLSIAIFAFFGGICRGLLNQRLPFLGTFLANIIGCFLLASLTYFVLAFRDFYDWLTVGLGTGFIGSFTTFSSFNLDSLKLLLAGKSLKALLYLTSGIAVGLLCAGVGAYLGIILGKKVAVK